MTIAIYNNIMRTFKATFNQAHPLTTNVYKNNNKHENKQNKAMQAEIDVQACLEIFHKLADTILEHKSIQFIQ
jgi:hypothetical protein